MNHISLSEFTSRRTLIIVFITFLSILLLCPTLGADTSQSQSSDVNKTLEAITFMVCILIIKVTALILGYLIVKLGHDTLIKGITGDIDFGFEGKGLTTKLKAGSPGAFFVLAGAAVIMWALFVEKPFEYGRVKETTGVEQREVEKSKIKRLPEKDRPKTKRD